MNDENPNISLDDVEDVTELSNKLMEHIKDIFKEYDKKLVISSLIAIYPRIFLHFSDNFDEVLLNKLFCDNLFTYTIVRIMQKKDDE